MSVVVDTEDAPGLELVTLGPMFVVDHMGLTQRESGLRPTLEQCGEALRRIGKITETVKYWRGDLMNLTETLFHEEAAQVIDSEALDEKDAKAEMFVASRVAPSTRAHALSWDHARAVAKMATPQQIEWLDKARESDWSARKLANEIAIFGAEGKTVMRWWLVVECGTEAKRDKLAEELGPRGYIVKKQEKMQKVPKPKKAKKEAVTAQRKHRGAPKMNTRKRVPK
jgi:hypothetical protein